MDERKLPTHIRTGRVEKVVQEIEHWIDVFKMVIDDLKISGISSDYTEGKLRGMQQALEIIEKNIYESRKTEG